MRSATSREGGTAAATPWPLPHSPRRQQHFGRLLSFFYFFFFLIITSFFIIIISFFLLFFGGGGGGGGAFRGLPRNSRQRPRAAPRAAGAALSPRAGGPRPRAGSGAAAAPSPARRLPKRSVVSEEMIHYLFLDFFFYKANCGPRCCHGIFFVRTL